MFMFTPFLANYGYGVGVGRKFNRRMIGHGGGIHGFLTKLDRYLEEQVCVVVLSNLTNSDPNEVAQTLAAVLFDEEYAVPDVRTPTQLEPGVYESYAGEYQLAPGIVLTIQIGNQRLIAETNGGSRAEFVPESEMQFFRKSNDDRMTFFRDETGNVTHLILRQQDVEERADRFG